jgi:antitoxin component YwqK of YwqJK toxin-antitoxin module
MNQYDENGIRHGPWETYYGNNKLLFKGNYVNGKLRGLCQVYSRDGLLINNEFYL